MHRPSIDPEESFTKLKELLADLHQLADGGLSTFDSYDENNNVILSLSYKDVNVAFPGLEFNIIIARPAMIMWEVTIEPGHKMPKHWHNHIEVIKMLKGKCTFREYGKETREIQLEAGQFCHFPPGLLHEFETEEGCKLILTVTL